jgi:hypothetical protein
MPRIQFSAHTDELYELEDCPLCGRTVFLKSEAGLGYVAACGRRLVNIKECLMRPCVDEQEAKD